MKKIIRYTLITLALMIFSAPAYALSPDDITAQSAVLMDADTGQILFDKNMDVRMNPASITKIMTGMLVMEHCSADDIITVSADSVNIPYDTSHIALNPGEELTVNDAMYALMLPSANDAANALAEHVSGSQAGFAGMMNERAKELGALRTNFFNAHGLTNENHYTTAHDMALITRAAIKVPGFLRYYGAGRYKMPPTNLQEEERPFSNYQYMLLPEMWVYNPDVIGGKVGYTKEAGHTMSTAATKNGRTLVCVVMNDGKDEKFYDTQTLLDYGFDSLRNVTIPLPLNELSALTVPVLDGGAVVGEANFSLQMKETSLLIPDGATASDIRFDYNVPESIQKDSAPKASVTLSVASAVNSGFPELLAVFPLSISINDTSSEVDAVKTGVILNEPAAAKAPPLMILSAAILLILFAILYLHIKKRRRIAARRLHRRQHVQMERQQHKRAQ